MKPQLLKISHASDHSFSVRNELAPNINNRWHYHPEIELISFHKGLGTQFVGDHISRFEPGDVVLVGSNLPHFWKYDDEFYEDVQSAEAYSTVIHFFENFIGEKFLHLPETRHIKAVHERAKRGILFRGDSAGKVRQLMTDIQQAAGINRIIALINCLSTIAHCDDALPLATVGFNYNLWQAGDKRINAVYKYSFDNFQRKIKLNDVAEIAGITTNSFCRFFKSHTGKTYSDFITEIRLGYAHKLLISDQISVKEVCFESGFNSFSHFHECFKKQTGTTPQLYQRAYKEGKV